MKFARLIAGLVLMAVVSTSGCTGKFAPGPQDTAADTPQGAMGNLALRAGYEISGNGAYEGGRWTINVTMPLCSSKIELGGTPGPQNNKPTEFDVLSIRGTPWSELAPGKSARNLQPNDLVRLGLVRTLACPVSPAT